MFVSGNISISLLVASNFSGKYKRKTLRIVVTGNIQSWRKEELRAQGRTDSPSEVEKLDLPWHQPTWLGDFVYQHAGEVGGYILRRVAAKKSNFVLAFSFKSS